MFSYPLNELVNMKYFTIYGENIPAKEPKCLQEKA
jgi:hypothetical protein